MGRRLPQTALLKEIEFERSALDRALALLNSRQMTRPGVTRGGWSVKDILAHLVEWQKMNLRWYEAGLRGEKPEIPAPGFTLRDLPRLSQMICRKYRRHSLRSVRDEYERYHAEMVALIRRLSDEELTTLHWFSWTGPSWTLSDYLRASTAAHYLWARTRIRRWMRKETDRNDTKYSGKGEKRDPWQ